MAQIEIYRDGILIKTEKVQNLTEARAVKRKFIATLKKFKPKSLIENTEVYFSERKII
jgi:hypothetical protein